MTMSRWSAFCVKCGSFNFGRHTPYPYFATGSEDLDFRTPKMNDGVLSQLIKGCESCGYVNPGSLMEDNGISTEFLMSDAYKNPQAPGMNRILTRRCYLYYLEMMELGNLMYAYEALLMTAWSCDDEKDNESARYYRNRLIDMFETVPELKEKEEYTLRHIDIMRRAGRFDELIEKYADYRAETEYYQQVVEFQLLLARNKIDECYSLGIFPEI